MTTPMEEQAASTAMLGVDRVPMWTLAREAWASLAVRPSRSALAALAVGGAVAALVVALGLVRTAADESLTTIDQLSSTEISIGPGTGPDGEVDPLPLDAASRVRSIVGVVASGTLSDLTTIGVVATLDGDDGTSAGASEGDDAAVTRPDGTSVVAASAGIFDVLRSTVREGRVFDSGHVDRADTVAVLGPDAATELGIVDLSGDPEIVVGDEPHVVIGILDDVERRDDLLGSVFVPESTATARFGLDAPGRVLLESAVGQAEAVTRDALVALGPGSSSFVVDAPTTAVEVRAEVDDTLDELFVALGVALAALGIVVVTVTVSTRVRARRAELGLRRAFGARRGQLVTQLAVESLVLVAVGALVGAAVGMLTVLGVAAQADWSAALGVVYPLAAIAAAVVVALLVAVVATLRATRAEPADAVRSLG